MGDIFAMKKLSKVEGLSIHITQTQFVHTQPENLQYRKKANKNMEKKSPADEKIWEKKRMEEQKYKLLK